MMNVVIVEEKVLFILPVIVKVTYLIVRVYVMVDLVLMNVESVEEMVSQMVSVTVLVT
jgi:hypothetical protein